MMGNEVEEKRTSDLAIVLRMIEIYCRGQHKSVRKNIGKTGHLESFDQIKTGLCPECAELARYVQHKVAICPVIEEKTFCSSCKVHCYAPEQRERIRMVMRYAGPRMMLYDPPNAVRHLADTLAAKRAGLTQ